MTKELHSGKKIKIKFKDDVIITSIRETRKRGYDGIVITTNVGKIKLLIDNSPQCCESFGLETPDDTQSLVGEKLISINTKLVDIPEEKEIKLDIKTRYKSIQFSVYNLHNGYYAHKAIIVLMDKKIKTYI